MTEYGYQDDDEAEYPGWPADLIADFEELLGSIRKNTHHLVAAGFSPDEVRERMTAECKQVEETEAMDKIMAAVEEVIFSGKEYTPLVTQACRYMFGVDPFPLEIVELYEGQRK